MCEVALFYQIHKQITRCRSGLRFCYNNKVTKGYCLELIKAIVLGLVQGFTEFIPVSSSGHLILVGHFINFSYSGLAFDVALDIGTLAALYIFFWKDFWNLAHDFVFGGENRKLAGYILLATIPAVLAGVLIQGLAETVFRNNALVAFNLIWVGLLMLFIDRMPQIVTRI